MGTLLFGRDETTTCIADIAVTGRDHEPLCLAFKTTKTFVGAGVWLKDDGYVLRPRAEGVAGHGKGIYYPLTQDQIVAMQEDGDLPTPLPAYSVPLGQWAIATSLYWVVAIMILFSAIASRIRKRWRAELDAERRDRRVSFGPPERRTEADRFIADQIAARLRPGERVLHQAHALDRDPRDGTLAASAARPVYVAMTSERFLLLRAKAGLRALRPVEDAIELDRSEIASLRMDDELFTFVMDDGAEHTIFLAGTRAKGSNERAFLLDVPRILAGEVVEPGNRHGTVRQPGPPAVYAATP